MVAMAQDNVGVVDLGSGVAVRNITRRGSQPFEATWPTKFTPEVRAKILALVEEGNYITTVVAAAGISRMTWHRWLRIGMIEPGEQGYVEELHKFYLDVLAAEAKGEVKVVNVFRQAATEDWQAAQKFLATRYADRWSGKTKVEMTGENGGPIEFTITLDTMAGGDSDAAG